MALFIGLKMMLNQRPNSDADPVLPTKHLYIYDLRDKNTSLYTNTSTFHALAHINLFNFFSLILKLLAHF